MPARYLIRLLLIATIFLLVIQTSFADITEKVQNLNEEGKKYVELGDFENAINSFKEAIRLKPDYADAYNNIGVVFDRQGNYEKALEFYKQAIRIDTNHFKAYFNSGVVYFNLKKNDEAIESFKKAIKLKPDFADAFHLLGSIYLTQGNPEEALKPLEQFLKLAPDNHFAHFKLGLAYSGLKDYDTAEKFYMEALKIKSDFADVYLMLGNDYLDMEQYEKAIETFKKTIQIKPDFSNAYLNLGIAYSALKDYDTAEKFYLETLKINPKFAEAYEMLGYNYLNLKQYENAINAFKNIIKLKPDFVNAYLEVGLAYIEINENEKAEESFKKVIELKLADASTYYRIGLSYAIHRDNEKAIEFYKRAIALKPDYIEAHQMLAITYTLLGKHQEAVNSYKEIIRMDPNNSEAYYSMGLGYSVLEQHEKAIEAFSAAIKLKPDFADAYSGIGRSYFSLNNFQKAVEFYKASLKLKPDHADIHYMLGLAYQQLDFNKEAIEAFKSAIRIKPDYSDAYHEIGSVSHHLDQDDKAIEYFRESMKLYPDTAEPLYWLGFNYFITGKFKEAISYLENARNLYEKTLNKNGQAKALIILGETYMNLGKDIYAINNFQKASALYEELKDLKGLAGCFNGIALVYFQLSDNETAVRYFQKALEIYKQLNDDMSTLRILGGITLIKFAINKLSSENYEEIIKHGEKAIEFAEKKGLTNDYNAYGAYFAVGLAYWELKDYENALKYREKILTIAQKSKMKFAIAFSFIAMAMGYNKLENYQQASDYIQKALNLSDELEHPSLKWMLSWGCGQIAEKSKDTEQAKKYYFDAVNILETVRENTQSLASKISLGIQATNVYNDTVLFLIKFGEEKEAFNYMERAKSRAFLDLLGRKSKLHALDSNNKDILEEERQLQFKINYLLEKISEVGKEAEKKGVSFSESLLEKELNDTRAEYATLLEKIKNDYPELSSLLVVNTLTLQEAQEILDPNITLLEYYITPEKTLLWVVDKSDLKVIEIPIKDKELKEKVNVFREKIANLNPDYGKDADELYNLLIKPAKQFIKTKRIGIVPHSVLHYLPFHALLNNEKFLIEEYEMFYTPSASVLKFVYEKRKEVKGKVLAFGNPDIGDESLNLPYAEDEVKKIKNTYPDTALYLKEKATEDKAKTLSGDYNIIHFASHGELNPTNPMFSSIRLAKDKDEDGRLEVNEIFNLNLKNTSLVTLSACETGLGKLTQGDELVGLTRGFIYAGTPSIVASLWKVNDQSTSEIMSLFYKNLKSYPKSESLRMAQLEMIRGKTGKGIVRGVGGITTSKEGKPKQESTQTVDGSHPYFWAPFILLGDWK